MKHEISERLRKYLLIVEFADTVGYTVWGTDMADEEMDKMIVDHGKLILFQRTDILVNQISRFRSVFKDVPDLSLWASTEDLTEGYAHFDFSIMLNFRFDNTSKDEWLALLDCLNTILDFALQTDHKKLILLHETDSIRSLKDHIYNTHFWRSDAEKRHIPPTDEIEARNILLKIYAVFRARIIMI